MKVQILPWNAFRNIGISIRILFIVSHKTEQNCFVYASVLWSRDPGKLETSRPPPVARRSSRVSDVMTDRK